MKDKWDILVKEGDNWESLYTNHFDDWHEAKEIFEQEQKNWSEIWLKRI